MTDVMAVAEPLDVESLRAQWIDSDVGVIPRSYGREVRDRFLRQRVGMAAVGVLLLLVVLAALAPVLTSYDPLVGDPADRLLDVGARGHLLGTDEQGRDMLTRLLYGGRLSLIAGFVPVVVAGLIGAFLGMWAGLVRGVVGNVIMRVMDMLYAFPAILLAIAVGASLGPGLPNAIIASTIVFIPPLSRVAESATRSVVVQEYVEAAKVAGARTPRLLRTEVFPNVINPVLVYASGLLGLSMIIAASLSFLGLGSLPPAPEWGYMLNSLRGAIYRAPVVAAMPGAFVFLTSVSFNLISDALREAMDIKNA